jgi:hypothetical protein
MGGTHKYDYPGTGQCINYAVFHLDRSAALSADLSNLTAATPGMPTIGETLARDAIQADIIAELNAACMWLKLAAEACKAEAAPVGSFNVLRRPRDDDDDDTAPSPKKICLGDLGSDSKASCY